MTAAHTQCRYLRGRTEANVVRCTAEVVDPDGDLLLCSRHLARAIELYRAALARVADRRTA